MLHVAFGLQVLAMVVVLLGDFGFDRPGRYGLDFGHFILIVAPIWCVAALTGLILSLGVGWRWFCAQWLLLAMPFVALFLGSLLGGAVPPAASATGR